FEGGIGAAAVLIQNDRRPRVLRYHLGSTDEHTVYEAEAVGLTLAAQLLTTERDLALPAAIYVDNQAAIKSGDVFNTKPGHYLIDHFRSAISRLRKNTRCRADDITVSWISGHDGVEGNEKADDEAKKAAKGDSSSRARLPSYLRKGPLPLSVSALKQAQHAATAKRWAAMWAKSPRFEHLSKVDPRMLSGSFVKLAATLTRRHTSLLVWLRTKHTLLNAHLHRLSKSDSPDCPHCPGVREDVLHFILGCPQYVRER
ncbi:hypothetical protein HYDPIDRAFT_50490, partial [Hydnomerulius pinastri MD-312]